MAECTVIVSELNKMQEEQIPLYTEKWKTKAVLIKPITPRLFEQGLRQIHEELGMEPPIEFLYYQSPAEMWREFKAWKPKITRVLTQFWSYQLPLCDPLSMHRRWSPGNNRIAFNFAAKRYSLGYNSTLRETDDSDETSGTLISRELHSRLWQQFDFQVSVNWGVIGCFDCSEYKQPNDYLLQRAEEEDPTTPMPYQDYCFLSPCQWLLRELAYVDFCHHVLKINRNERLYTGLEAIIENGSFCGIFGRLCVASERPCKIEIDGGSSKLFFTDGAAYTYSGFRSGTI